ncbi:MAG: M55 family metallopeptidase [Alphaproteobacteria bacterium]|nr:M55 family metallopeptidase [Alphaproteobacteria bacterium]
MKKVFISTDMEGIALARRWGDVNPETKAHAKFAMIQTLELLEIIKGIEAVHGKCKFVIRDAHWSGTNLLTKMFPKNVAVLSHWRGADELGMMAGLDNSFDFAILHGYHAAGGSGLSPLEHTWRSDFFQKVIVNKKIYGETSDGMYKAAYFNVPVIMITGDSGAIAEAKSIYPNIITIETKRFESGTPVYMLRQQKVRELLRQGTSLAASIHPRDFKIQLPNEFVLHFSYVDAHQALLQPQKIMGVKQISSDTVEYKTNNFGLFLKTLRKLRFLVKH